MPRKRKYPQAPSYSLSQGQNLKKKTKKHQELHRQLFQYLYGAYGESPQTQDHKLFAAEQPAIDTSAHEYGPFWMGVDAGETTGLCLYTHKSLSRYLCAEEHQPFRLFTLPFSTALLAVKAYCKHFGALLTPVLENTLNRQVYASEKRAKIGRAKAVGSLNLKTKLFIEAFVDFEIPYYLIQPDSVSGFASRKDAIRWYFESQNPEYPGPLNQNALDAYYIVQQAINGTSKKVAAV